MAQRPSGVQSKCVIGAALLDQVIKATPGVLYSVNISWTGATADDLIHIHDCATVAEITAANRIFTFRVTAAAGYFAAVLPVFGKAAASGLVLNIQASAAKFSIDIGFD